jgi:hypothetical protein
MEPTRLRGGSLPAQHRDDADTTTGSTSSRLTVGAVDDPAERDADRLADAAVAALATGWNRPAGATTLRAGHRVQRSAIGAEGGPVDADTESRLRRAKGGGRPLAPDVHRRMGDALGADLSRVRVHEGADSRDLNDRLQARAFTVGNDIHFRDGLPDVSTSEGQHLFAHELAHTVQQGGRVQRSAIIRRVPARVLVDTELRRPHPSEADKIDDSDTGTSRSAATVGQPLEVDTDVERTDSGSPASVYVQTKKVGSKRLKRYVKLSAIELQGAQGTGKSTSTSGKVDKVSDKIGGTAGILPDINDAQDGFKANGGTIGSNMESGMGVAAGAGDTATMFTGLAQAIVAWRESENGSDKAGALMSGAAALGTGAKGISGMVDKGGGGEAATSAAQGIAGFADAFVGIKDTFFAIKHIVELVQQADKLNDKEKFSKSMEIITEAMSAAKSGVSSAKAFMDLWGGGAGAPLVNAVPGLGIALAAVDIIIRTVDLVDSQITRHRMQSIKRTNKTAIGGAKGASSKSEAEAFIRSIDDRRAANDTISDSDEQKYDACRDYLMAKGLQYISQKRTNRAILKISVAMGKMAGDVAVLGGASAPVGVGVKGGAMALDVGASLFRRFKQWGRDKAANGSTGKFFGLFDKDKSTTAKMAGYNAMVDKIFDMIIKASKITQQDVREDAEAQVGAFVGAMGLSVKQMHSMKDNPVKLRESMIKAMQKRE